MSNLRVMSNPYAQSGPQSSTSAVGRPVASVGKRIGGRLLDTIILSIAVGLLLVGWLARRISDVASGDKIPTGTLILAQAVGLAIGFLYEVPMVAKTGQTLGKKLAGTRVVRLSDGQVPGWNTAVLRWIPALVGLLPGAIGSAAGLVVGVGSLILLFTDPLRQTVYDKVAKTIVIDA